MVQPTPQYPSGWILVTAQTQKTSAPATPPCPPHPVACVLSVESNQINLTAKHPQQNKLTLTQGKESVPQAPNPNPNLNPNPDSTWGGGLPDSDGVGGEYVLLLLLRGWGAQGDS